MKRINKEIHPNKIMKFGYFVRSVYEYPEIRDLTLKVEKLGFDSVHVNDHFFNKSRTEPFLEAMMLTSALAIETSKIKIGHVVLCNSFRNPAYLAKMVCTLDNISNGRALFWLGAGWFEEEYKGFGYLFPTPKQRVDELEESIRIYKKLFTEELSDSKGNFWKLEKNLNIPKPIQKPYPQIVLGTSGKRMTDIACREADGINLIDMNPEKLPEYVKNVKENLQKYNRDISEFEISFCSVIILTDDQEETEKLKVDYQPYGIIYTGYPEDIKEEITNLEDLGITRIMLWAVNKSEKAEIKDPLETFASKLMK